MKRKSAVVLAALACSGCGGAATAVVDRPSGITLSRALVQTVEALYDSRKRAAELRAEDGRPQLGLNVCTVSATFNIAATGSDTRGVTGTVGTPPNLYLSATVTANTSSTSTATRGNQVTVTFTSPACNPPDTLGTRSPGDVVLLEREIEAAREGAPDPIRRLPPARPVRQPRPAAPAPGASPAPAPAANPAPAPADTGNTTEDRTSLNDPATTGGSTYFDRPRQ